MTAQSQMAAEAWEARGLAKSTSSLGCLPGFKGQPAAKTCAHRVFFLITNVLTTPHCCGIEMPLERTLSTVSYTFQLWILNIRWVQICCQLTLRVLTLDS